MVTDEWIKEVSTNLEQGQGYIEDDVQTLKKRKKLEETRRGKTIMFICISMRNSVCITDTMKILFSNS